MVRGNEFWNTLIKFKGRAEWKERKRLVWHLVNMREHEMRVGALLERLVNKALPVDAREWNPGDIYSSEREHERSLERWEANTPGHNTRWGEEARGWGATCKHYPLRDSETQHLPCKTSPRLHHSCLCSTIQPHLASAFRLVLRYRLTHWSARPQNSIWNQFGHRPSRCESGVQLGAIKEGWVGLLKHINMYEVMNLTGHSKTSH